MNSKYTKGTKELEITNALYDIAKTNKEVLDTYSNKDLRKYLANNYGLSYKRMNHNTLRKLKSLVKRDLYETSELETLASNINIVKNEELSSYEDLQAKFNYDGISKLINEQEKDLRKLLISEELKAQNEARLNSQEVLKMYKNEENDLRELLISEELKSKENAQKIIENEMRKENYQSMVNLIEMHRLYTGRSNSKLVAVYIEDTEILKKFENKILEDAITAQELKKISKKSNFGAYIKENEEIDSKSYVLTDGKKAIVARVCGGINVGSNRSNKSNSYAIRALEGNLFDCNEASIYDNLLRNTKELEGYNYNGSIMAEALKRNNELIACGNSNMNLEDIAKGIANEMMNEK